jgi:hypothetical protein
VRNDSRKMCQTFTVCVQIRKPRTKAKLICMYCERSMMRRRSRRSASAPPMSEKRSIGPVERKPSTPRRNAEFVIERTTQLCATVCIQVPVVEVNAPNQSRRKSR